MSKTRPTVAEIKGLPQMIETAPIITCRIEPDGPIFAVTELPMLLGEQSQSTLQLRQVISRPSWGQKLKAMLLRRPKPKIVYGENFAPRWTASPLTASISVAESDPNYDAVFNYIGTRVDIMMDSYLNRGRSDYIISLHFSIDGVETLVLKGGMVTEYYTEANMKFVFKVQYDVPIRADEDITYYNSGHWVRNGSQTINNSKIERSS